jgi:hypothetical protein
MERFFHAQHPIKPATKLLIGSCPPVNWLMTTARTILALDLLSPR